jgi:aspartyl-tRNA(Asn)/glutamyl-tRNA(Gln) amidotransferase subunit A
LDSIGPLARTVAQCAIADAVMAAEEFRDVELAPLADLRLGLPQGLLLRDLDETVSARFSTATAALGKAGARLSDEPLALLEAMTAAVSKARNLAVIEGYAIHGVNLADRAKEYDPFVRSRLERGRNVSAADYITLARERARLVGAMDTRLESVDALVLPTTAIVAPMMSEVATLEGAGAKQGQVVRNTSWVNFFDLCAISVPLPREGSLPVGLMLVGRNGQDHRLFRIAAAVERLFS